MCVRVCVCVCVCVLLGVSDLLFDSRLVVLALFSTSNRIAPRSRLLTGQGARWFSMEMAGIVCLTGSNIITKVRAARQA